MEPHDITSYPLKLPFIRSSKMAKRDSIGTAFQTQEDERFVRPSQYNDNFLRRSQAPGSQRGYGGTNARAPIEVQLDNFRRKAIEMGFTGPDQPMYGSQPAVMPESTPGMLHCDSYAAAPDISQSLFPLARSHPRPFGEDFERREEPSRWSDRFRMPSMSQPCRSLSGMPSGRSNLDHTGAPSISDHFRAPFDFSLAEDDSPPYANSQLPQRPFPLAGEPSTMFGALPHDAGFSQAALPPHCRWTSAPAAKRRQSRIDFRRQRNFTPSSKMFEAKMIGSPPALHSDFSLDTTSFGSPRPPWKTVTNNDRLENLPPYPPRPMVRKRRPTSATQLPVKKFKSAPTSSPLCWDSDADLSPDHQSDPILARGLALSPIAKSTPCLVPHPDPRSIKQPDRPASNSPSLRPKRPVLQQRGVQTSNKISPFSGINTGTQTDVSTNMSIFRETGCSPLPWKSCPSCGCHREAAGPSATPTPSPHEDPGPPVCRSASSGEMEATSFLTDFLIGVEREE